MNYNKKRIHSPEKRRSIIPIGGSETYNGFLEALQALNMDKSKLSLSIKIINSNIEILNLHSKKLDEMYEKLE
jgi:hypothetical protein